VLSITSVGDDKDNLENIKHFSVTMLLIARESSLIHIAVCLKHIFFSHKVFQTSFGILFIKNVTNYGHVYVCRYF
jgi:hypothetical protein